MSAPKPRKKYLRLVKVNEDGSKSTMQIWHHGLDEGIADLLRDLEADGYKLMKPGEKP